MSYNDEYDSTYEMTEDSMEEDIEFINSFFMAVAGTENYEIVPIPDENGEIVSAKDLKLLEKECKKLNLKLIYRVSHIRLGERNVATVLDPISKITGVMPDFNGIGFPC